MQPAILVGEEIIITAIDHNPQVVVSIIPFGFRYIERIIFPIVLRQTSFTFYIRFIK